MAGMEEVEIHSKSYLVRWVNAKPDHSISWTVQPHKKSINFGIFKHPGHVTGTQLTATSNISLFPPPSPSLIIDDDDVKSENAPSVVIDKLRGIGLRQVAWIGRCDADKVTQGRYDVPPGESGNYAMVFDNTFSKSLSKTATFFLLTYPTAVQSQVQFGAQMHHSQAMAGAMGIAASVQGGNKSPRLRPFRKPPTDSQRKPSTSNLAASVPGESAIRLDESSTIHTGVLSKRRRKKGQGFARRFFCLDYTTSTLSYYHDRNSSALRGAIPLSLAAIGANAKTREISIDSGAEIWHLRAPNHAEFGSWKAALEKASRLMTEATTPADGLALSTTFTGANLGSPLDDYDLIRLETLLSRISGIRDAVRRLSLDTIPNPSSFKTPPSGSSNPTTPTDGAPEDYFGSEQRPRTFWKRKASNNSVQSSIFKRSVSSQLAVPLPGGADTLMRNGTPSPSTQSVSPKSHNEQGLHDHCMALLRDLDAVVAEFNTLVTENRIRRNAAPMTAASRLSIQSVDSQEFFDAADGPSQLLALHSDSEKEEGGNETDGAAADEDSETSSDPGDDSSYAVGTRGSRSGSLSSFLPSKAKNLQPLPLNAIKRRETVAAPTVMPPSLIGFMRKNVGKDLSTLAMPVSANEPTSLLQRAAEALEYSELLDQAAKASDTLEQLMFVAAFALSPLSNARVKERSIRKPFNPMLGETYELVREDKGFRLISEKVSHRPVQLAFHAESSEWAFTQSPKPLQKFWGKSAEINTEGKARLVFHNSAHTYSWIAPTCFLRNIIAGEKYIEPVGHMTIFSETDGSKAVATFKAKGMFSGRSEEVEVQLFDSHGAASGLALDGTWTGSLQKTEHEAVSKKVIWSVGQLVPNAPKHYGMTSFAAGLNEITAIEKGKMAPTDSRLRPDQQALETGQHNEAEQLKNELEEAQRERRRDMEESGEQWKPRWFTKVEHDDEVVWKLKTGKDGYWDERAKGQWTGVIPVLKL